MVIGALVTLNSLMQLVYLLALRILSHRDPRARCDRCRADVVLMSCELAARVQRRVFIGCQSMTSSPRGQSSLTSAAQHPPAVLPSALDQSGEDAPWPIIDVVYTWVNGSDERMQERTRPDSDLAASTEECLECFVRLIIASELHMVKLAAGLLGACNETHREGCDESSVATSSRFQGPTPAASCSPTLLPVAGSYHCT